MRVAARNFTLPTWVSVALLFFAVGGALGQKSVGAGAHVSAPPPPAQSPPPEAASSHAQSQPAPPQAAPKPTLADFSWLEGTWQGVWGPRIAEQVWVAPQGGMMLGSFRLVEAQKTLVIELFSLVEKPDGIKYYVRHFTPELVPWEKSDATILNLLSLDGTRALFENPVNGEPKHIVFTRTNADTYISRSEILPENGADLQVIEITYHRVKPAAPPADSSAGNASRR
jgi:hypothetical protein